MTVTLAELKYQSPKDKMYVTEATIGATFRADVSNANRRYSGRYGASWISASAWRRIRRPTPSWSVTCSAMP